MVGQQSPSMDVEATLTPARAAGMENTQSGPGGMKPGIKQECVTTVGQRGLSLAQCCWHMRAVTPIQLVPSCPSVHVPQLQGLIPTVVPTEELVGLLHVPHSPSGPPSASPQGLPLLQSWFADGIPAFPSCFSTESSSHPKSTLRCHHPPWPLQPKRPMGSAPLKQQFLHF